MDEDETQKLRSINQLDWSSASSAYWYQWLRIKIGQTTDSVLRQENLFLFQKGPLLRKGVRLTASRQRRIPFDQSLAAAKAKPVEFIACDSRYFWNKNKYQLFAENNISVKWCTPIICGNIGYAYYQVEETPINVTVISRRQNLRAGTRLNVSGIDDDEN